MADTIELGAVKRVLGDDLSGASMSCTKSAIGHLLGGAGAVETIFCILAIRDQIVPPTLNLDNPDEGTEGVDLVPHGRARSARCAPCSTTASALAAPMPVADRQDGRLMLTRPVAACLTLLAALALAAAVAGVSMAGSVRARWPRIRPSSSPMAPACRAWRPSWRRKARSQSADASSCCGRGSSAPGELNQGGRIPAARRRQPVADPWRSSRASEVLRRFVTMPEGMPSIMVYDRLMAAALLTGRSTLPPEGIDPARYL